MENLPKTTRIVGKNCPYHIGNECRLRRCRLIVEEHLGRFLSSDESIHHIGSRENDSLENLYLFSSIKEHTRYHAQLKRGKIEPITKSNLI